MSMENFALLWLDFDHIRTIKDYLPSITYLQPLIHTIELILNQDDYFTTIDALTCERFFVIISGNLASQWVADLNRNEKIDSIYLHSIATSIENEFTKRFQRVRGMYSQIPSIFDALRRDIRRLNIDLVSIEFWKSLEFSSLALSSLSLRNLLINDEMFRANDDDDDNRQKSIEYFRKHYAKNSSQLKIVNEYVRNDYREYSPIQWYTRESFLYQMIQRALKTFDMEMLYHLAPFIRDLHRQINEIYRQTNKIPKQRTVYYSQSFNIDEIRALENQSDHLLTFNTFVFGTTDENDSLFHAEETSLISNRIGVIFHIHIDQSSDTFPYVIVDDVDYFQDTNAHILFSFNAVFRLISIEKRSTKLYQIDLILINENDEMIRMINRTIETNFHSLNNRLRLAELFYQQKKNDRTEKLLHLILEEKRQCHLKDLAWIHLKLADINGEKSDWNKALIHLNTRLNMEISMFSADEQQLGFLYGKIGQIEYERNNFEQALNNFQHALTHSINNGLPTSLAIYHERIGEIFLKKNEKISARRHWNVALDILSNSTRVEHEIIKRLEGKILQLK